MLDERVFRNGKFLFPKWVGFTVVMVEGGVYAV